MKENIFKQMLNYPEEYMLQGGGEYQLSSEMSFLRVIVKYKDCAVVIYGGGRRCEYLIHWLNKEEIPIKFIMDNDMSKHNKKIGSHMIYHPDKIPEKLKLGRYLVLVSTIYYETEAAEIIHTLLQHGMDYVMYPFAEQYGVPAYKHSWVSYYTQCQSELLQMFRELKDGKSKETIFEYVKTIITNCVYKGEHGKSCNKYFEEYAPVEDECFLNIGSYVGDSIFYFIENRKEQFEKIYGIEGDGYTYQRLRKNIAILPDDLLDKIELHNRYLDGSSAEYFKDKKITLISMDIEGMEREVMTGL